MSAITIRIPESIYGHLKKVAQDDGVSINQFFVTAAAEKLAALDTEIFLRNEAAKGSAARGLATLARAPDTAPEPDDRLPAGYVRPRARRPRRSV
jgi:hypothetical protein